MIESDLGMECTYVFPAKDGRVPMTSHGKQYLRDNRTKSVLTQQYCLIDFITPQMSELMR